MCNEAVHNSIVLQTLALKVSRKAVQDKADAMERELLELRADIAAYDRLISRAQQSDPPSASAPESVKPPQASPPLLQKVNVAQLIRDQILNTNGSEFTLSSICSRARAAHPMVEILEGSIAPMLGKLVSYGAIAVVQPRAGNNGAVYRLDKPDLLLGPPIRYKRAA